MVLSKRDYCFFKRFERQARKELLITKDSIKYEEDKFGKVFGETKKGNSKARVKIN
jgi:hypothetical protein